MATAVAHAMTPDTTFFQLIESAPAAIAMFNREMEYLICSRRWINDFRLNDEDVIGKSQYDIFPQIGDKWKRIYNKALAGEELFKHRDVFERQDGSRMILQWKICPWRTTTGNVGGVVVFTQDVTSAFKTESKLSSKHQEVDELSQDLAYSNRQLARYAHIVSHDLKEPIRKLASFCELLAEELSSNESSAGKDFLKIIISNAKRAQKLVDDVLGFVDMERKSLKTESVQLKPLIDRVVDDMEIAIKEANAVIEVHGDAGAEVDVGQFERLFLNLIQNALKFAKDGEQPKVIVNLVEDDDAVVIEVIDNGIGIDPRFSKEIFLMFRRLNKAKYSGTGMGLAVCESIVRAHEGTISAANNGSGTIFCIRLPYK